MTRAKWTLGSRAGRSPEGSARSPRTGATRSVFWALLVATPLAIHCGGGDDAEDPSDGPGAGGASAGSSGTAGTSAAGAAGKGGSGGSSTGGKGGSSTGGKGGSGTAGTGATGGAGGDPTGAGGDPTGAGGDPTGAGGDPTGTGGGGVTPPPPSCKKAATGSTTVQKPELLVVLKDRWEEAWLASPAVADLDGDGKMEIIVPREDKLVIWGADGTVKAKVASGSGRIWSSPIVADLRGDAKLEIAFAAGTKVFVLDAAGAMAPGFPVTWVGEMRAIAAGDLDGDGKLDLVTAPAKGGQPDVMNAWRGDGTPVPGFPPNGTGTSGCAATKCYLAGCYDQNVAIGDLDGDGKQDVIVPHDNAYASFHKGTGVAFDANPVFKNTTKTPGVRYLHDLAEAAQGYANDEATSLQAHFTNTAPAIADLDGDGKPEVLMLASVQNASQDDRLKGVALWALHADASRLAGWETPFHAPDYVAGLWDYDGTNVVGATNQVTVADIDPTKKGPELVFVGFDGRIHAVGADKSALWTFTYTTDPNVLSGGVVVGDLSGDGSPEIVFASYSIDQGKGALFILDSGGNLLHKVPLPRRGAMPVPTLADVDGDGTVEIVVSLKDAEDKVESVDVFTVKGSATNCLLWPTGRGNYLRNGWVK